MKKRLFLLTALVALLGVGLYALATPVPVAHAASPVTIIRFIGPGPSAEADFRFEQGGVSVLAIVFAERQSLNIPESAVQIFISECITGTEECSNFNGSATAPELQGTDLTSMTLPEITVQMFPSGGPDESGATIAEDESFPVTLALTWTGVGSITTRPEIEHTNIPHVTETTLFTNVRARDATMSGFIAYSSPRIGAPITLTGDNADFSQLMTGNIVFIIVTH